MTRITAAIAAQREKLAKKEEGFTLIELLVVVIIIGILAAIAIPVYIGVQNSAKEAALQSDINLYKNAVVAYYTQEGEYPGASVDLGPQGYPGPSQTYDTDPTFTAASNGTFTICGEINGKAFTATDASGVNHTGATCGGGGSTP